MKTEIRAGAGFVPQDAGGGKSQGLRALIGQVRRITSRRRRAQVREDQKAGSLNVFLERRVASRKSLAWPEAVCLNWIQAGSGHEFKFGHVACSVLSQASSSWVSDWQAAAAAWRVAHANRSSGLAPGYSCRLAGFFARLYVNLWPTSPLTAAWGKQRMAAMALQVPPQLTVSSRVADRLSHFLDFPECHAGGKRPAIVHTIQSVRRSPCVRVLRSPWLS